MSRQSLQPNAHSSYLSDSLKPSEGYFFADDIPAYRARNSSEKIAALGLLTMKAGENTGLDVPASNTAQNTAGTTSSDRHATPARHVHTMMASPNLPPIQAPTSRPMHLGQSLDRTPQQPDRQPYPQLFPQNHQPGSHRQYAPVPYSDSWLRQASHQKRRRLNQGGNYAPAPLPPDTPNSSTSPGLPVRPAPPVLDRFAHARAGQDPRSTGALPTNNFLSFPHPTDLVSPSAQSSTRRSSHDIDDGSQHRPSTHSHAYRALTTQERTLLDSRRVSPRTALAFRKRGAGALDVRTYADLRKWLSEEGRTGELEAMDRVPIKKFVDGRG